MDVVPVAQEVVTTAPVVHQTVFFDSLVCNMLEIVIFLFRSNINLSTPADSQHDLAHRH